MKKRQVRMLGVQSIKTGEMIRKYVPDRYVELYTTDKKIKKVLNKLSDALYDACICHDLGESGHHVGKMSKEHTYRYKTTAWRLSVYMPKDETLPFSIPKGLKVINDKFDWEIYNGWHGSK